jgi:hypothetical protein
MEDRRRKASVAGGFQFTIYYLLFMIWVETATVSNPAIVMAGLTITTGRGDAKAIREWILCDYI